MNEENADFLVGLVLGAIVFSLIGFSGIRSLISGLRNLSMKKHPRIYNYFGIITGVIIVAWVLFLFLVISYLWLKYK